MQINRIAILSALSMLSGLTGCSTHLAQAQLQATPQNALVYAQNHEPQSLITPSDQQNMAKHYLAHYFSPWTGDQLNFTSVEVLQAEQDFIAAYTKKPGYGENQQPLDAAWISGLAANMHLQDFPDQNSKAITLHATALRVLPTEAPSFAALKPAWDNYPFDTLQDSYLPANLPLLALHTTHDRAWTLVLTHNSVGWVHTQDIAPVDADFIQHWQHSSFISATRENIPVIDDENRYHFNTRLGALYPLVANSGNDFIIAVAAHDEKGHAIIKHAKLAHANANQFPLPMTEKNIAELINTQLGMPYGWGGMYGYRDCSAMLADIYSSFGIWLPRNSHDQVLTEETINVNNLSEQAKKNILATHGKPFLTLIGLPGHIMLYVGQYQNRLYVANTLWGLHTKNIFGKEGRIVIGKAVIMPIDIDTSLFPRVTILSRVNNITVLGLSRF